MNVLFLVPGEVGGSEPLVTNLILEMARSEVEIVVFAVKGFGAAYPEIRDSAGIAEAPWSSGAQPLRIAAEHSWLATAAARRKLDLLHHWGGTAPFFRTRPAAVTIHDIQYLHYPGNFRRDKLLWLRANVPSAARRSRIVCVPSEFTRRDVVSAFHVDPAHVYVIPFGSERLFGPAPASADEVRDRYQLDRPFFFFPSRTYPHKNHRMLLEAYAPLSRELDLVLTGAPWPRDREIETAVRHLGLTGKVRRLGLVPRADLAGLYEAAVAFLYPTLFEGFGAPLVEAMSASCPVIASTTAAVPEVVEDAGILVDPNDVSGWTESMAKVWSQPELRSDLSERARRRALEFSWEGSARLQLAAYDRALR